MIQRTKISEAIKKIGVRSVFGVSAVDLHLRNKLNGNRRLRAHRTKHKTYFVSDKEKENEQ